MTPSKNRIKSRDVDISISERLKLYRFNTKRHQMMFDFEDWHDLRLIELMDKVYGNHR